MHYFRLAKIIFIFLYYRLAVWKHQTIKHLRLHPQARHITFVFTLLPLSSIPRGQAIRKSLESLGPIFIKFGQMLSVRKDLLPDDITNELSQLQQNVVPSSEKEIRFVLENAYNKPIIGADGVFETFSPDPVGAASVAQVHLGTLKNGQNVAIKILRPRIKKIIRADMAWLKLLAYWLEIFSLEAKRLRLKATIKEFEESLNDELDLMREAANCSQLRQNFKNSTHLKVPQVYWDYCREQVMVMEKMTGIPIDQIDQLQKANIDLPTLGKMGVSIFFTQVFSHSFFHADMHPGNILVSQGTRGQPSYVALDFGIMGTLSEKDQHYLAVNFLAFFRRDYRRVALAHIESGWAPPDTRPDKLEAAIRTVCEPIFDRPLKEISQGIILLRLFQISRRFNIPVQPQLILLQKTLLSIEGLGRQLDPDLDLWQTAKPFLENWMKQKAGWRTFKKTLSQEVPFWASTLPQIPRLIHESLAKQSPLNIEQKEKKQRQSTGRKINSWSMIITVLLILNLGFTVYRLF